LPDHPTNSSAAAMPADPTPRRAGLATAPARPHAAQLPKKVAAAVDAFQSACDLRMAQANEAAAPKNPLFHYTKEKALFGILDSGKLWFTSIYHMDDPEELNFGFGVARELFKEAAGRSRGLARRFCRERAEDADRQRIRELIAFYSVSFGLRDVEKQWTKYADEGRGVALGLAPEFFTPAPFEDPDNPRPEEIIFYGKVSYGPKDGRARHEQVVDGALALIEQVQRRKWLGSSEEAALFCHHLRATIYTEILWNCVTTKDATWSYQNEMRILARNVLKKPDLLLVNAEERPRVELVQPRLRQSIAEIMVGPKADGATLQRVRAGFSARGLGKVPVTQASAQ
jgi:hypothetical protein